MTALTREAARVLSAVQFLTRLPVPDPGWEEGRMRHAARYFALVGAGVGLLAALVWLVAGVVLPAPVAAGLALATAIALTGALHEDGLADTADGLGATTRERALEIMRDSRIGAYACLTLVLTLGLRWAALAALSPGAGALALVLAASTGRGMMVAAAALSEPARTDGLGAGFRVAPADLPLALAVPGLLSIACGWGGVLALLLGALAAALIVRQLIARLGGYTGDGLGAVAALSETAVLLVLAAVWGGGGWA